MERKHISNCWYKDACLTEECPAFCLRCEEMKYLMQTSGIPESKQFPKKLEAGVDYEAFVFLNEIKQSMEEFVSEGKNLYIMSKETGNGKTSWAIKLLSKYFDSIWAGNGFQTRGLFVHVPSLLLKLKNFENPLTQEFKDNLINADLVVWDDIGSTSISNYDYSQLLMYLDQRLLEEKSNIFTSNINSKSLLQQSLGSKLASRIWNTSEIVEFNGGDRR